ncbi:hypothetical protein N9B94_00475 [Verrucomicrobia bacterium]|nr:hypothetical protein [Verrucomicrobiota bacterium]
MTFQTREKLYKPALGLLVVLMLLISSNMQSRMNVVREEGQLNRRDPLENAPPLLAFTTVALGGFRGIISNILWMRATKMQMDGKYFELIQLADWITKLQPTYKDVWKFQAWNMAYNVSIKFTSFDARWHWVNSGISLLRDEAIPINPHQPELYEELCRFLSQKVGGNSDDAHQHFKIQFAGEWHLFLGDGQRPDYEALIHPKTPEEIQRATLLDERYHMDPNVMRDVDEKYGPLEWRLPETHAIYWATIGEQKNRYNISLNLRRHVFQSMLLAVRRGRMLENRQSRTMKFGPNIHIIGKANQSYEDMMNRDPEAKSLLEQGHRTFLMRAVRDLYLHNRKDEAKTWFAYGKDFYADWLPITDQDLEAFIIEYIMEDMGGNSQDDFKTLIITYMLQAYYFLAMGDEDQFLGYQGMSQKIWKKYYETNYQFDIQRIEEKLKLPDYSELKAEALIYMFTEEAGYHPQLLDQLKFKMPEIEGILELAAERDATKEAGKDATEVMIPFLPEEPEEK